MRLRVVRGIVLSAVAAALVTPAHAETPSASTVPALAPWTRFVLPNGLVALVGERPGIPIVVVRAAVEAGSVLDPPRRDREPGHAAPHARERNPQRARGRPAPSSSSGEAWRARGLRRERVSEEELSRARSYLVGSFPLRMDTAADVSDLLVAIERFALGLDYPARFRRAVSAVTAEEVLRTVRTHWDADAMSLALVGNLREAGIQSP